MRGSVTSHSVFIREIPLARETSSNETFILRSALRLRR